MTNRQPEPFRLSSDAPPWSPRVSPRVTTQQQAAEAAAFSSLVTHLRGRLDVPNIELMILGGFCRNCLAKWYLAGAWRSGLHITYDQAARQPRPSPPHRRLHRHLRRRPALARKPLAPRRRAKGCTACPTRSGRRRTSQRRPWSSWRGSRRPSPSTPPTRSRTRPPHRLRACRTRRASRLQRRQPTSRQSQERCRRRSCSPLPIGTCLT